MLETQKLVPLPIDLSNIIMSYFQAIDEYDVGIIGLWEACKNSPNRKKVIGGACRNGHTKLAIYLMSICVERNVNYWLYEACKGNEILLVNHLMMNGVSDFRWGIIGSVKYGNLDMVKYLLPYNRLRDGNSFLYVACEYGHLHIVKYLLDNRLADNIAIAISSAFNSQQHHIIEYLISGSR